MTSNPHWGQKTSALNVAAEFADRIKDRNVIITGVAPNGVGEGTAIAFASQEPANLILVSRTKDKLEAIANIIRTSYPGVNVRTIVMDLASQESIRKAVAKIESIISTLDILVNNAGCTHRLRNWTAEGIEMQFGVNHIGTFLFTKLLFPLLKAAAAQNPPGLTRIVNLSSHGHMLSPIRFHDYNMENKEVPLAEKPISPISPIFAKASEDGYLSTIAYSQSKTANILFTLYLQGYAKTSGIMAYALHPGGVISNLGREHEEDVAKAIEATSKYWKNSDEGASTSLVAALDPALDECCGLYLADCQFFPCADHAKNPAAAQRLWQLSEELIGGRFVVD
ncbi:NAD(P)-binding protein [Xylaria digitata]|nr:NAD(P)-binding protein [Xylaria digitata]